MADWLITDDYNKAWTVRLADCDQAHAESVLENLRQDPYCPNDLVLEELDVEPELEPAQEPEPDDWQFTEEPVYQPEPEPKRRLFRRSK